MKDYKQNRYICNDCNWEWETLSVIIDADSEDCPSCGSFNTQEAVVSPEVRFVHFTDFDLN